MYLFSIILACFWGVLYSIQSPTNASLGKITGSAQASFISFLGGFITLVILVLLLGKGDITLVTTVPFWQLLGGIYGSIVVFGSIISIPILGVALTLTVLMFGQLFMGAIIDTFGLLGANITPLSTMRLLGLALAVLGIICIYVSKNRLQDNSKKLKSSQMISRVIVMFIAGLCGSIQVPTNTSLSNTVGSLEASLISFAGGVIVLFCLMMIFNKGKWHSIKSAKPWQLIGGLYGAIGIFITIIIMPYLGVVALMTGTMFGQLASGMIVDMFGLIQCEKIKMDRWRFLGVVLFALCIVSTTIGRSTFN